MIDTQHLTVAFYSKESGPKGRSDFRLKNADFRFKSSGPRGKECMHLNLQSPICNHKSYTDWHQGPGFLCRIKKEAIITDRLLSSILVELVRARLHRVGGFGFMSHACLCTRSLLYRMRVLEAVFLHLRSLHCLERKQAFFQPAGSSLC